MRYGLDPTSTPGGSTMTFILARGQQRQHLFLPICHLAAFYGMLLSFAVTIPSRRASSCDDLKINTIQMVLTTKIVIFAYFVHRVGATISDVTMGEGANVVSNPAVET